MLIPLSLLLLAAVPEVALLSTAPDAEVTELRLQPVGDARLGSPVARLVHLPQETVLGAVIPGTRRVVATAVTEARKDLSFASSLFLLEPNKPTRTLCDRVVLGSRPLVSVDGRVFVQRGRATEDRIDALTIDEVDLRTGRTREVLAFSGSVAFLAGSLGRELLIYRVGAQGADLVAVHADALGVRVLIPAMPPLARDFALAADQKALFYTQGDPSTGQWYLERLDLQSLARTRLAEGPSMALLPTPLPDGRIAFAPAQGAGLQDLEGKRVLESGGPGFERVRFFTRKRLPIGLHEIPGDFPAPLGGFAAPARHRLDVAGVIE
ncbi:MAG: hypothetical protein H6Q89_5570 [Myxococcaceae bacterium]|nr:hypothetical protein [Myxococcaceae bacterium]